MRAGRFFTPQAAAVADVVTVGDEMGLRDGYLALAGFPPFATGLNAAIRGRIDLLGPRDSEGDRVVLGSLWSDYIRAQGQPMSRPGIQVYTGWAVRVVTAGSTGLTTTQVTAQVFVTDEPTSPGPIVSTLVGPDGGPGDRFSQDTNNPAAGADPSDIVVGLQTLQWMVGGTGILITDANVSDRGAMLFLLHQATSFAFSWGPNEVQAGSTTRTYDVSAGEGGIGGAQRAKWVDTASPRIAHASDRFRVVTVNLEVGDNWSAVTFEFERWAVID